MLFNNMTRIGVVIKILPSLLKKSVMRKHKRLTYQNKRIPDPFALSASFSAIQLKNPKLSKTIAMTIVAIIVMAAPLMVFEMIPRSDNETLPISTTIIAPIEAGIDSFMPLGLQRINPSVAKKVMMVIQTVKCSIFSPSILIVIQDVPETTLPPLVSAKLMSLPSIYPYSDDVLLLYVLCKGQALGLCPFSKKSTRVLKTTFQILDRRTYLIKRIWK